MQTTICLLFAGRSQTTRSQSRADLSTTTAPSTSQSTYMYAAPGSWSQCLVPEGLAERYYQVDFAESAAYDNCVSAIQQVMRWHSQC